MHGFYLYFSFSFVAAKLVLAHSSDKKIIWSSPSSTDHYHSGDQLNSRWSAEKKKGSISPSFSICDRFHSCGIAVWPEVKHLDDGSYQATVYLPDVTSKAAYYLQMEYDGGKTSSSPEFTLSPRADADADSSTQEYGAPSVAVPQDGSGAQMPLSMLAPDSTSHIPEPASNFPPNSSTTVSSADSYATPLSHTLPSEAAHPASLAAASHGNMPSVVALAVPISLAGAILIGAVAMFIDHRVKRSRNRDNAGAALRMHATDKAVQRPSSLWGNPFTLNTRSSGQRGPVYVADFEKSAIPSALLAGNPKGSSNVYASIADNTARAAKGECHLLLQAREASLTSPPDYLEKPVHPSLHYLQDEEKDGDSLANSSPPSQKFEEILLSPRVPLPLHVRNGS